MACILGLVAAAMITVPLAGDRDLRSFFVGAGKSELKIVRRRFLLAAVGLLLVNQLIFLDTHHQQDRELLIKSRDLTGQVTLLNYLKDQLDAINANREKLAEVNQQLASSLASYPEARPAMQKFLEDNQADLQVMDSRFAYLANWVSGWQSKLATAATTTTLEDRGPYQFKALQEQKDLDKKMAVQCNDVFEFAIASLRASLAEQARQMGENLVSTYNGIPLTLQTKQFVLGSFSLGDRPSSCFCLSLKKGTSEYDPNCLCITCVENGTQIPAATLSGATLEEARLQAGSAKILYTLTIQPNPDKIVSTFQVSGQVAVSETFPQADYGRGVNAALSRLFATQVVKNTYTHAAGLN